LTSPQSYPIVGLVTNLYLSATYYFGFYPIPRPTRAQ